MTPAWLITQCIQNDFVSILGRYDSLPNLLHIGAEESRRLMGDGGVDGPVGRVLQWAYAQSDDVLRLVHVRDWHDADDPLQHDHLRQFGAHCLKNTSGAEFAFEIPDDHGKTAAIIDSTTLNDFMGTDLQDVLTRGRGKPSRLGLIGVWTEAKVTFLAYELRSRFPDAEIAVCSALTASSSRTRHFLALEQLREILGVRLIDSVGGFIEFLGGDDRFHFPRLETGVHVVIEGAPLSEEDNTLVRYVFRGCRQVSCRPIGGGFSGSRVLACESEDLEHRMLAPCVVKLGQREPIADERMAFEQIEAVLGNAAPSIDDYADFGQRGAIKYRYASMDFGAPVTLQKVYQSTVGNEEFSRILDIVFGEQLGRLYAGAERNPFDLLGHYGFAPPIVPMVQASVTGIVGEFGDGVPPRPSIRAARDLLRFYTKVIPRLPRQRGRSWWQSWGHGDLNGANVVIDSRNNVWVIDFSHAGRGHVLRDLIKFENDLIYLWSPCQSDEDFLEGLRLVEAVFAIDDLAAPLPTADDVGLSHAGWRRAWNVIRQLRGYYLSLIKLDRDPLQVFVGQLRYAAHSMSFDECNDWQKKLALHGAALAAVAIEARMDKGTALRIDWLPSPNNRIGITLLPGRKDYQRTLIEDLAAIAVAGVSHVLSLVTRGELELYGVPELDEAVVAAGLQHLRIEIFDQQAASFDEFQCAFNFMDAALESGGRVLIHCVGGLGRSGMIAAGYLVTRQRLSAFDAIEMVRICRSRRAIETVAQEGAVARLAPITYSTTMVSTPYFVDACNTTR